MIRLRIPRKLTWTGCIGLFILMTVFSLSVTALITLGVHFVLPQFDYWKEFVVVFIVGLLLAQIGRPA